MDAELVTLASTAGTTLVGLLVTDAWGRAQAAVSALWRQARPEQAEVVEGELVQARDEAVAAHAAGDSSMRDALIAEWQLKFRRLLASNPDIASELRHILNEELNPALPQGDQAWAGNVTMRASSHGNSKVFQVGQGNLTIKDS
ncbi:hypothetical protein [Streptomyces sp. NPDC050388]|uniref:hypothetical protein n=1 Tax=Streptomyces sp. NPDC050388 TaxID=3155781 RepID=UPI00341A478D